MELLQNEGRGARLFARRRERTSRLEALIERQSTPVAGKSATEGRAVPPLLTGCADTSEKVGVDLQWGAWPTRVTPPVGVAAKLRSTSSKKAPLKSGKVPRRPLSSLNRSARPFTPISSPHARSPTISLTIPFVQVSSNTMPQPFPPLASPLASPYTMPPPLASSTTAYSFPQSGSSDIPPPRSGLLDSARGRHNQHLPMFTFQERPKLAPNPDLLSLVQRIDTGQVESQDEGKEVKVNPRPSSEVVKAKLQAGGRGAELFRRREFGNIRYADPFNSDHPITFQYATWAVTKQAIKEARLKVTKQQLINYEQYKTYFEDNPNDLHMLRTTSSCTCLPSNPT